MIGPKHSPYLKDAMNDTRNVIERACHALREVNFEAIVVTGVSGMLIGPTVAHIMGKRLAVIRKQAELNYQVSHSEILVETNMKAGDSWVFFDDLVATGDTVKRVERAMTGAGRPECVGRYLYNENIYYEGSF